MKTKDQIKKWLFSQPWFSEYVEEVIRVRRPDLAVSLLEGEYKEMTISGAFSWAATGNKKIWETRDETFRQWLISETFENIKEGQQFYYEGKKYVKVGSVTALEVKDITSFPETCEVIVI